MAKRKSGKTIFIQVDRDISGAIQPQFFRDRGKFIEVALSKFEQVGQTVADVGERVAKSLRNMESKPTSCTIEFGLTVGGETGVPFVTKGTLEADFKVSVEWKLQD